MLFRRPFSTLVAVWYLACAAAIFGLHAGLAPNNPTTLTRSRFAARPSLHPVQQIAGRRLPKFHWERNLQAIPPQGAFHRLYRVRATAYMPRRAEGGRYTVTQRDGRSAHGVAVDPRIIPLGTHLWIPGYGPAIADDTGSAIQGHRIDIRVQKQEQESAWGARQLCVYVLQDPRLAKIAGRLKAIAARGFDRWFVRAINF